MILQDWLMSAVGQKYADHSFLSTLLLIFTASIPGHTLAAFPQNILKRLTHPLVQFVVYWVLGSFRYWPNLSARILVFTALDALLFTMIIQYMIKYAQQYQQEQNA